MAMGEPPIYIDTKTGDIIRAIVLSSRHTWNEIQNTTGFTEKELNYHLHLLFNDNVIFQEKNEYYIIPELEQQYLVHFQLPPPVSIPNPTLVKPTIIKKFSVFNLKGLAIIAILLLSLWLNISNIGTIYQLETQLEEYAPIVQSHQTTISSLESQIEEYNAILQSYQSTLSSLESDVEQLETQLEVEEALTEYLTEYALSLEQQLNQQQDTGEGTSPSNSSSSSPDSYTRTVSIDKIATVTRVVDGDTFVLSNGDRVRLADIDAPESYESGFTASTDALSSLVLGKTVYLDVDDLFETDVYGRYVCVVYIKSGSVYSNVNHALLASGHADLDDYHNQFDPSDWGTPGTVSTANAEYITDSSSSSSSSSGSSSSSSSSGSGSSTSSASYVGSVNSDKYHKPSCYWAGQINPSNEIWFTSKSDAASYGYVACKVCDP